MEGIREVNRLHFLNSFRFQILVSLEWLLVKGMKGRHAFIAIY